MDATCINGIRKVKCTSVNNRLYRYTIVSCQYSTFTYARTAEYTTCKTGVGNTKVVFANRVYVTLKTCYPGLFNVSRIGLTLYY